MLCTLTTLSGFPAVFMSHRLWDGYEVPGETVTVEVIKEVMVPGETVVVEKEVVKTVEVPGETVVVEQEVVKTVEVVKEVPRGPVGDTTKAVGAFVTIGSNLDPRADGHKPSGFPIFDPLLHMNQDHEVEPYLAESWEASPALKQITFHLRDDAKFHTGDPVEARDIIQTNRDLLDRPFPRLRQGKRLQEQCHEDGSSGQHHFCIGDVNASG